MDSEFVELWLPDEAATETLGESIGRRLAAGVTVALVGDLGAGKTCLVRGLARGLGVEEPAAVSSPTYLLAVEHPGPIPLLHMDAYLPEKLRAFLLDGGIDYLAAQGGVVAVEWAERIQDLLPADRMTVELLPGGDWQSGRCARISGARSRFPWLKDLPD